MDSLAETQKEKRPNRLLFKHILRKIFLEDWLMKAVALAITLALWLGVTGLSETRSDRYNLPLRLRLAENMDVTNDPNLQVEIRVGGDTRRLADVQDENLRVSVDLTALAPGDHRVVLSTENVVVAGLPTGIKFEEIQPNEIAIRLEAVEEKDVPVKVLTRGAIGSGYELFGNITATPATVRIRGPLSMIEAVTVVETETVDLTGRSSEFTEKQKPLITPGSGKVTMLPSSVDVRVPIRETRIERLFLLPLSNASDRKATVVLFGPRSLVTSLKPDEVRVTAAKDPTGTDTPQVILPTQMQGSVEIRQVKLRP
jgi:YbbR domain-containing protein